MLIHTKGNSLHLFCFALLKVAAQKSITEVGRELAELVDQLVDTVRSLQSQSCLPESEPDKDLRTLASVGSSGRRKNGPGGGAKDNPLAWLGSNRNVCR